MVLQVTVQSKRGPGLLAPTCRVENHREAKAALEALELHDYDIIDVALLNDSDWFQGSQPAVTILGGIPVAKMTKKQYEACANAGVKTLRELLLQVLNRTGGNLSATARELGVSIPTLYAWLKQARLRTGRTITFVD